jgi:disulfide bond formation protein DsbB
MGMILFAAATLFLDTQVGVELIVGGVALITLVTGAYIAGATVEDVKLWDTYLNADDHPEKSD